MQGKLFTFVITVLKIIFEIHFKLLKLQFFILNPLSSEYLNENV